MSGAPIASPGCLTSPGRLRLRLPATSANLGPGFDAAAVALDFYLEIDAEPAAEFSILASGYDAERCGRLENNLILEIYKGLLAGNGWRRLRWRTTLAGLAGPPSRSSKRHARWKAIPIMPLPAGWEGLWPRPARVARCMWRG